MRTASMIPLAINIAVWNPTYATSITSNGVTATPPQLAPRNARLIARPRRFSNQAPTTDEIITVPMPTHPSDISVSAA